MRFLNICNTQTPNKRVLYIANPPCQLSFEMVSFFTKYLMLFVQAIGTADKVPG